MERYITAFEPIPALEDVCSITPVITGDAKTIPAILDALSSNEE